ncbi:hypothetical protein PsorP6_001830 [Peronosclerospora sorghi]|uniref:Uncharacterized protein n=1 Tax=Peronosclerospora sorghi TaxID=230839 RepID=A0ACC0WXF2_9STRA|nr:hypothetical protein PsorP6_001830 [Peronosclerospora sorghi]
MCTRLTHRQPLAFKAPSKSTTPATIRPSQRSPPRSGINQAHTAAFDGNFTQDVTSWKWHIHTKWSSALSSDSYDQCSKAATGNHYDPLRACGPASEYVSEPECQARSKSYACSPSTYAANPLACEKGDLSSKFGAINVGKSFIVTEEWKDENYPLPSENTDKWSMVLHAVCGEEAPRIARAVGVKREDDATQSTSSTNACATKALGRLYMVNIQPVLKDHSVPFPPSNNSPLDLSSDLRQQLCITRHRAYERYQENAQWAKELLERPKSQNGESFSGRIHAASV